MRALKRPGEAHAVVEDGCGREGAALPDVVSQRPGHEVLHGQVRLPGTRFAGAVDPGDIWVPRQLAHGQGLAFEPSAVLGTQ